MKFPSDEFTEAVDGLCDGTIGEPSLAELGSLLRADLQARDAYLWQVELHLRLASAEVAGPSEVLLESTARSDATTRSPASRQRPSRGRFAAVAALAGLLATAALCLFVFRGESPVFVGPAIVVLTEASGTVWFREAGSDQVREVATGAELPAGVLTTAEVLGATILRFGDGTEVSLATDAELSFAADDDGRKQLSLGFGSFSARVQPQPADRPLSIRTTTAEMLVLGTVFNLAAESQSTRLEVETGMVRMTRLSDGRSIDVEHDSVATATSSADAPFTVRPRGELPASWTAELAAGLPLGWKLGRWKTERNATGDLAAFVQTEREPTAESKPGKPRFNHVIGTTNGWSTTGDVLARLREDTVLRMTVRKARPGQLHLFVCVRSFGGPSGTPSAKTLQFHAFPAWKALPIGEWGEIVVPLGASLPAAVSSSGGEERGVFYIALTTYDRDLGLELKKISLE